MRQGSVVSTMPVPGVDDPLPPLEQRGGDHRSVSQAYSGSLGRCVTSVTPDVLSTSCGSLSQIMGYNINTLGSPARTSDLVTAILISADCFPPCQFVAMGAINRLDHQHARLSRMHCPLGLDKAALIGALPLESRRECRRSTEDHRKDGLLTFENPCPDKRYYFVETGSNRYLKGFIISNISNGLL